MDVATLAAVLVWVAGRFGLDVSAEELLPIVSLLAAYVVGQGIADAGKAAAQIERGDS